MSTNGEIFKLIIPLSRGMTQGSRHPLDGEDEPNQVNVGNIFTDGISMGFVNPVQVNTDEMQQQIQTNQNLLNNQGQIPTQNGIDTNQIMMQNQQMFGGSISGAVGQGFWDHKNEQPPKGQKTKQFLTGLGIPTAVFILSAIIIISADPYAGNRWNSEYSQEEFLIDQSTTEPQMFELDLNADQFVYDCYFGFESYSYYNQESYIDCEESTDYYYDSYYEYGEYYERPSTGVYYHIIDENYDLSRITLEDGWISIPGENLSVYGVLVIGYFDVDRGWGRDEIMPDIENNSSGLFYNISEYEEMEYFSGGFYYLENDTNVWIDYHCDYDRRGEIQCYTDSEIQYTTVKIGDIYSENQTVWISLPENMDVTSVSFYIFDESEAITDSDWLMYEIASVAMPILSLIAVIVTAVVGFTNNRKSQGWGAISSIIVAPAIFVISSIIYLIFFW